MSATATIQNDTTNLTAFASTPPHLPASQSTSSQELPGTGPGQVNGLFTDDAGVDHDLDQWTKLLVTLRPYLQDDLGSEWRLCFARFIDYERCRGFEASLRLPYY